MRPVLCLRNFLDWCNEAISDSRQRLNESRILRRFAQSFAQPHYCRIQAVVEINERVTRPESFAEFLAGDNFSRPLNEDSQNAALLFLKLYLAPLFSQFVGEEVHLEQTKPYEAGRLGSVIHDWRMRVDWIICPLQIGGQKWQEVGYLLS